MDDVARWHSADTIRRTRVDQAVQETLPTPQHGKTMHGDRARFDAHVNIESPSEAPHLKTVTVFSNAPEAGAWEFLSDDGAVADQEAKAPSPLMYFAAGLGLCLMSQVERLARARAIEINSVRLEQVSTWTGTPSLESVNPNEIYGKGELMQLNLIIDSPAPAEKLIDFVGICRQACMALQSVAAATPVATGLYLNGRPIGDIGSTGPVEKAS